MTLLCSFTVVEVLSGSRPPAQLIEFISKASELKWTEGENVERKKKIIIGFPHADECMQLQIPDVKLMFYLLWMCMEGERGRHGEEFWTVDALQMQHRKRGTSPTILEWTEISCKAEMLCLGQARAELWSANKLGFFCSCVTVLASLHSCVKTSAPSLAIQAIWKQTERKRNPYRGIPWSFGFGGNLLWTFMSFGGVLDLKCTPRPVPFHCGTNIMVVNTSTCCGRHDVRAGKAQWKGYKYGGRCLGLR